MSSSGIFFRGFSDEERAEADIAKLQFCRAEGDVLTMLDVYRTWSKIPEDEKAEAPGVEHNARWVSTTLRTKDPKKAIAFYTKNFGMKHLYTIPMESLTPKRDNYYLGLPRKGKQPNPDTDFTIVLCHHRGDEDNDKLKLNHGNDKELAKPTGRGFGHIAFNCADVYKSCEKLEKNGVKFQKKPDDGRMKGLAFALDEDGYWIEIVKRSDKAKFEMEFNISQTMIRVKDPKKSLNFYETLMGMDRLTELHFDKAKGDFSLYFLGNITDTCTKDKNFKKGGLATTTQVMWEPALELTHNHGTESDKDFKYHNGIDEPAGFHSIGFLVDDMKGMVKKLAAAGAKDLSKGVKPWSKEGEGKMTMFNDPDGYQVQIMDRSLIKSVVAPLLKKE